MTGRVRWTPSISPNVIAQDLLVYINNGGGPAAGITPETNVHLIENLNPGDQYDIYGVAYRSSGLERAVGEHLIGTVPPLPPVTEPLLPPSGFSITFF